MSVFESAAFVIQKKAGVVGILEVIIVRKAYEKRQPTSD